MFETTDQEINLCIQGICLDKQVLIKDIHESLVVTNVNCQDLIANNLNCAKEASVDGIILFSQCKK